MNLIQISASMQDGAYYYDRSTQEIYHVPHADLQELNNVSAASLMGGLAGGILAAAGITAWAKVLRYGDRRVFLLLLLLAAALSSCLVFLLVKRSQKRISRLIRDRYRPLREEQVLSRTGKRGGVYVQISVYCALLFLLSVFSLSISIASDSVLYALFSVVLFDAGVMVLAILQPLGKMLAYSGIKRRYGRR